MSATPPNHCTSQPPAGVSAPAPTTDIATVLAALRRLDSCFTTEPEWDIALTIVTTLFDTPVAWLVSEAHTVASGLDGSLVAGLLPCTTPQTLADTAVARTAEPIATRLAQIGLRAALLVPCAGGLLAVAQPAPRHWCPTEVQLLMHIAAQLASHLAARRARTEARTEVAEELHNGLLQDLYAWRHLLDNGLETIEGGEGSPTHTLRRVRDDIARTIREVRALIVAQTPPPPTATVAEHLQRLAAGLVDRGLPLGCLQVTGEQGPHLPSRFWEGCLPLLQEALTNAAKHAPHTPVTVTVASHRRTLTITLHNDGPGFDVTRVPTGMGLAMMRRRIQALGGTLTIASAPDTGTTLALTLPLS